MIISQQDERQKNVSAFENIPENTLPDSTSATSGLDINTFLMVHLGEHRLLPTDEARDAIRQF